MIAIYQDEGTSWKGAAPDRFLSAADIINGALDETYTLFIMPGGRDRPYHAALKGAGNEKIRAFVENGGTYLGICAGAYYGCKTVQFEKGIPEEICEERELAFFSGTAVGPAFGRGNFPVKIGPDLHAHYHDGCLFLGDFSQVRVVARYIELAGQPPAIIECRVGKGKAILSGVHLELTDFGSQNFSADQVEMQMENDLARICAAIRH
ncbi:MAG TPA: BPL-N domain-containing protein [Chlamydiales bacterium]|nr:BPL-N domain-containing protein [Chlamydiales bacterium]